MPIVRPLLKYGRSSCCKVGKTCSTIQGQNINQQLDWAEYFRSGTW